MSPGDAAVLGFIAGALVSAVGLLFLDSSRQLKRNWPYDTQHPPAEDNPARLEQHAPGEYDTTLCGLMYFPGIRIVEPKFWKPEYCMQPEPGHICVDCWTILQERGTAR